jgi:hypothetical protein
LALRPNPIFQDPVAWELFLAPLLAPYAGNPAEVERHREWAELAHFFTDISAPAGIMEIRDARILDIDGRQLGGISGSCLDLGDIALPGQFFRGITGGVHSAFSEEPLHKVWRFWETISVYLRPPASP